MFSLSPTDPTYPLFRRVKRCLLALLALAVASAAAPSALADATVQLDPEREQLMSLSLEDLMDVEIFSASRKLERLSETAAAVFVITQDDLRRSGVTTIPEALRLVPGMQVARVDIHQWAISARGFNSEVADKLLVLIDGRTVYSPLFSGVFWDVQDTLLEDIDRIEVIRGPGATLWGANAVNGIINIITRSSHDSHGGLVTAGSGSLEKSFASVRYSAALGDDASYRVFAKYFDRDELPAVAGAGPRSASDWSSGRAGFRLDWKSADSDEVAVFGEIYDGSVEEPVDNVQLTPPFLVPTRRDRNFDGGFVMGRWSRETARGDDLSLQIYYDHAVLDAAIGNYTRDTIDLEYQHRIGLGDRADLIWGLTYRSNSDDVISTETFIVNPPSRRLDLWSAYAQSDISSRDGRFTFTVGSKFENNDFTGLEIQPTVRFRWTLDERRNVWASVARAVHTPVRAFTDVRLNQFAGPLPQPFPLPTGDVVDAFLVSLLPNPDLDAEDMIAYEAGFRIGAGRALFFDFAAFFNVYDQVQTRIQEPPVIEFTPQPPHILNAFKIDNGLRGDTYGFEAVADWTPTAGWRLKAWYAFIDMQLEAFATSSQALARAIEATTPEHQASLRSSWDVGESWEVDAWLRYVDRLPAHGVDSYLELDLRLGWRPTDAIEISLVGRNLLDDQHPEFTDIQVPGVPSEIERSIHGEIKLKF